MCLLGLWTHNHREFCCMSRLCGVQLWQDNCKVVVLLLCEWLLPRKIDGHTMSACLFLFSQFLSEQKQYCLHSSLASCSSALNPKWQPPLKTLAQWNHDKQRRAHQCFGWPIKWMEKQSFHMRDVGRLCFLLNIEWQRQQSTEADNSAEMGCCLWIILDGWEKLEAWSWEIHCHFGSERPEVQKLGPTWLDFHLWFFAGLILKHSACSRVRDGPCSTCSRVREAPCSKKTFTIFSRWREDYASCVYVCGRHITQSV